MGSGQRLGVTLIASALLFGCTMMTGADNLFVGATDKAEDETKDGTLPTTRPNNPAPRGTATSTPPEGRIETTNDAGVEASAPSTVPRNPLSCDGYTCTGERPYCCKHSGRRGACVSATEACSGPRLSCRGSSDCATGDVCCADTDTNVAICRSAGSCAGAALHVVCTDVGQCASGEACAEQAAFELKVCQ